MEDQIPLHPHSPNHQNKPSHTRLPPDSLKFQSTTDMDTLALYKKALMETLPMEKEKRIDYVLVYPRKTIDEEVDQKSRNDHWKSDKMRERFEEALTKEGILLQKEEVGENVFVKLHVPFPLLCKEAEKVKLEMSLIGCQIYDDPQGCWEEWEEKYLVTDDEQDFVSAPFEYRKLHIYCGHDNPETFFRPAIRCFLTNHILINMDIRDKSKREDDPMARKGLPYLLMKKVYSDAFILHDESAKDPVELEEFEDQVEGRHKDSIANLKTEFEKDRGSLSYPDTRKDLDETWPKLYKYQPLWKIRNYFGEKVALYYAWSGMLVTSLWFPTLFGLAVFAYGLYLSITKDRTVPLSTIAPNFSGTALPNITTTSEDGLITKVTEAVTQSIDIIKESFDNEVTPFFALIICLWGTIFLELWKRKNSTLAYEWDVTNFEDTEPDRPQFYGVKTRPDPVTQEETWYYPIKRQLLKFMTSCSMLIFMICVVCISVAAVIVYRVIMNIDFCTTDRPAAYCLLVTTVVSALLNAISILILGKIYDFLAVKLTDWENHRTQTMYDDALIIKLFAFQFVNSYTSLFYIAFFRGDQRPTGIFGLGQRYQDTCGGSCMSMLSFQVLVLMLMKPIPKFLKDIIIPFLLKLWRKRCCCRGKKVEDVPQNKVVVSNYLERERLKPEPGDLTMGEYMEKILQYGYLMLFAASFPLAPLLALLTNIFDRSVDAKRLLWLYRRPISRSAQDIGMWYGILQFVNICGVISNAFLIAFTSSWGNGWQKLEEKLFIVIIFEHSVFGVMFMVKAMVPDVPAEVKLAIKRHSVFAIKFVIEWLIPDTPRNIRLAIKREKYQVTKILELATQQTVAADIAAATTAKPGATPHIPLLSPVLLLRAARAERKLKKLKAEGRLSDSDRGREERKTPRDKSSRRRKKRKSDLEDVTDDMSALDGDMLEDEHPTHREEGIPEGGDPNHQWKKIAPLKPSKKRGVPESYSSMYDAGYVIHDIQKDSSRPLSYGRRGSSYHGEESKFIGETSLSRAPVTDKSALEFQPPSDHLQVITPDDVAQQKNRDSLV